jgi:hypothetical protein
MRIPIVLAVVVTALALTPVVLSIGALVLIPLAIVVLPVLLLAAVVAVPTLLMLSARATEPGAGSTQPLPVCTALPAA